MLLGLNLKLNKNIFSHQYISLYIVVFNIFYTSFFLSGSLVDSFNVSLITFISAILIFFTKKVKIGVSFDNILIILLFINFISVNFFSDLIDGFRIWSRLFIISAPIFFAYSIFVYCRNKYFINCFLMCLILFSLFHCFIIFIKLIFSIYNSEFNIWNNLFFFGNIRHLSTYISVGFILSYFFIFFNNKKYLFILISSFILAVLIFLGTRSSFLSLFICCTLFNYYLFLKNRRIIRVNIVFLIFTSIFYFVLSFLNSSFNFFSTLNRTFSGNFTSGRTRIWSETWHFVENRPWGYGGDAFVQLEIGVKALGGIFVQPHNVFLQILIEWGVLSLCIIMLLFYRLSKRLIKFWDDKFVFLLTMAILNLLIISLFDGVFYYFQTLFLLFCFIAMLCSRLCELQK